MKKFLKVSSFVLALLMIMTSFVSVSVFASADDPRLTVGGDDSYDINIGIQDAEEVEVSETKYLKGTSFSNPGQSNSVNSGNMLIYKFSVPKLSVGKQINKTILRFAHANNGNVTSWKFKKIPGTDINGITTEDIKANEDANEGAITVHYQNSFVYSSAITYYVKVATVDISSYVQECFRAGQEYFYIALFNSSTYGVWHVANTTVNAADSGFNGSDVRPYIYYNETDAGELTYVSTSNPESTGEGVSFVFSNPIAPDSVSASEFKVENLSGNVEVSDSEISVKGSTVTLNKAWEAGECYTVSFVGSVTDAYAQTLNVKCNTGFELPVDCASVNAGAVTTFSMKSDGTIDDGENNYCKINVKDKYILYKFDLSEIDKTKAVIGADFEWTSQAKGIETIKILQVPNGTWADKESLAADIANNDYYNAVGEAAKGTPVFKKVFDFGSEYTTITHTEDVSAAVVEALNSGANYITFAFTSASTHNYFTNGQRNNIAHRPSLKLSLAEPSFVAAEAVPAKNGIMNGVNGAVELKLATTIAGEFVNSDYVELINTEDGEAADISVSAKGSKLIITPSSDLKERTEYKVVLKNGITDDFGNVLEADKTITRFVSGTALEFFEIIYTYDEAPVYDEAEIIESYNAGESVTAVAKFKNNSGTDLDAIMLIALYDSDNNLLSVDVAGGTACAPANMETQYSKSISVPSDAEDTHIKAFIWSDLEDIRPICKAAVLNQAK